MSRRYSKFLLYFLMIMYTAYILGVVFFTEVVIVDMSSPLAELYGFISAILILASLYSHAFRKEIFNRKVVGFILINTIICALWSYIEVALNDFELMSLGEIVIYTSLYFIIYPPILSVMKDLRYSQQDRI